MSQSQGEAKRYKVEMQLLEKDGQSGNIKPEKISAASSCFSLDANFKEGEFKVHSRVDHTYNKRYPSPALTGRFSSLDRQRVCFRTCSAYYTGHRKSDCNMFLPESVHFRG